MFKKLILSLLLLVCSTQAAQNFTKFSAYPRATSLTDYDLFLTATYSSGAYTTNKAISFTNLVTQLTSIIATGGTTINVGGSPVSGPNFVGTQFSASGTDVSIKTNALLIQPVLHEPIITNYVNANHTHENSDEGGTLDAAAIISGVFPIARLATGTPSGAKFIRDDGTLQPIPPITDIDLDTMVVDGTLDKINGGAGSDMSAVTFPSTGIIVTRDEPETLNNKTIVLPTIASMANAQHNHQNAAGGGTLSASAIASGTIATARLGSGTADSTTYLRGDQTWQVLASGSGDVTGPASSVDGEVVLFNGTGGKTIKANGGNIIASSTNLSVKGTLFVDNIISTNGIQIGSGGTNLSIPGNLTAHAGVFTNTLTMAGGINVVGESTTNTLTNKDIDTFGNGNTLKVIDELTFVYPSRVDGAGTTIVTNNYTSGFWGLATQAGTGSTNANYALFRVGYVPNLDSTFEATLDLAIAVSGTDADAADYTVGYFTPVASSGFSPTDFTSLSGFVNFSVNLSSPVANDIFYGSSVSLTGWASALSLVSGRTLVIGIARRDGSNDDNITIVSGRLVYKRVY
jgi:hypothetical protein